MNYLDLYNVQQEINIICNKYGITSEDIEYDTNKFSYNDKCILLTLLRKKYEIQKFLFKKQHGENIIFLSDYET